jgi:hypothetical protein
MFGFVPFKLVCAELSIGTHGADSPTAGLTRWCQRRTKPTLLAVDAHSLSLTEVLNSLLPCVPEASPVSVLVVSCRSNDEEALVAKSDVFSALAAGTWHSRRRTPVVPQRQRQHLDRLCLALAGHTRCFGVALHCTCVIARHICFYLSLRAFASSEACRADAYPVA